MTRGLLWLPLLVVFIGLTWAGWNEYQKVEAYRAWAQHFQRAKYDIYAVLGQNEDELTWGKPTRKGPVDLQTFSLRQVTSIQLRVDQQALDGVEADAVSKKYRQIALEFEIADVAMPVCIPFTELAIATQWAQHLQKERHRFHT